MSATIANSALPFVSGRAERRLQADGDQLLKSTAGGQICHFCASFD
jgi:hypothetical protein